MSPPPEELKGTDAPLTKSSDGAVPATDGAAPVTDSAVADADEDFARIPSAPRHRSPIVAVAVLAVAGILMAHLADDLRYWLSGKTPTALGEARALRLDEKGSALVDNTYVSVAGLADFRNALMFEPKGDSFRRAFFRLLGTGDRVLVRADETGTRHDLGAAYTGRLRRFAALPYAEQIRAYYAEKVKVSRSLELSALWPRLDGKRLSGAVSILDRSGETVAIPEAEKAPLTVVVDFPGELLIGLSREKFAVEEDARHEVEQLGVPVGPARETRTEFVYPVRIALAERNAFLATLDAREISFALHRERFLAPASELTVKDHALDLPAPAEGPEVYALDGKHLVPEKKGPAARYAIPLAQVDSVQLEAPVQIPDGAWVVLENELPSDFGFVPFLVGVLLIFALLNLLWLTRSLTGRKTAEP